MPQCQFTVAVALPGEPESSRETYERPVVAGRSEECDIRLPHPLISRRHVELSCDAEGAIVVRDLGSTNGTLIGDDVLRSEQAVVRGLAELQLGPYALTVTTATSPDDATVLAPARPAAASTPPAAKKAWTPGAAPPDGLSAREVEVLRLVARGRSNPEIGEELVISVNTVTRHVSNIFNKTAATNRVQLVRYAFLHGLED